MRLRYPSIAHALIATIACCAGTAFCQQAGQPALSPTEKALIRNAQDGRYTFIVFYKQQNPATDSMANSVKRGVDAKPNEATMTMTLASHPIEKRLVDKLGVSRAPMPLCVVLAPNGAVTGLFQKTPSADEVAKAFVTPAMTRSMKAMQDGKIVLLCVQGGLNTPTPTAVESFQTDPHFMNRVATVSLDPTDPAEAEFLAQLDLDAANKQAIATVLLAPPGVLVGKYPFNASQTEMASELHAAGKCCDDPNCKHHKKTTGNAKSAAAQHAPTTRRN